MMSILSSNVPWLFIVNSFSSQYFPFLQKKKSLISVSICHKMFSTFQVCHLVPNKGKQYSQNLPQDAPGVHSLAPYSLTRQQ